MNILVSAFLHVGQWILNSRGRDERAWEEWMDVQDTEAEAMTQHGKASSDPSAFLLTEEKWLSIYCLCSNTRWSLRGTEAQRCKGDLYL